MSINQRIINIINVKYFGNKSQFAKALGVSNTAIYNLIERETGPGFKIIHSIVTKLGIDANWLVTGEGEMNKQSGDVLHDDDVKYGDIKEELNEAHELNRKLAIALVKRHVLTKEEAEDLPPSDFDHLDPSLYPSESDK